MKKAWLKIVLLLSFMVLVGNSHSAEQRYTYLENDGVFMYYKTQNLDVYRDLLPSQFEMPDESVVYAFMSDFYKMDSGTTPYKETALFLLAKHEGKEFWYCVFMPVTSQESRVVGIRRLGLPKTMGDINFERESSVFTANVKEQDGHEMMLKVNATSYEFSDEEEQAIDKLSILPKLSLHNGELIQMGRTSKRSLIDLSKFLRNKLVMKAGAGELVLKKSASADASASHPMDLQPSEILAAYYLKNSIPFRLNGRAFK